MKIKNQLFIAVMVWIVSCSVIRDHPRQDTPNSEGPYMLTLKIINDEAAMDQVRNVCLNISSCDTWNQLAETGNYVVVHLQYRNISSGSLNQLLGNLKGIHGLQIIDVKPIY